MCASQQHGGAARVAALGGMLLLPFAIAFIVFGALRRAGGLTASINGGQSRRRPLWLALSSFRLSSFRLRRRPPQPLRERCP